VTFDGVGLPPPEFSIQTYGYCTQIAIFRKKVNELESDSVRTERNELLKQRSVRYDFMGSKVFPTDERSLMEKIASEAQYVISRLSRSPDGDDDYEGWHAVKQMLESSIGTTLRHYCEGLSSDEVIQVLSLSGLFDIEADGKLVKQRVDDSRASFSDSEANMDEDNDFTDRQPIKRTKIQEDLW